MLFPRHVLERVRAGTVTLAFRRWQRPTVRSGGTLHTAVGLLHIREVSCVTADALTEADAQRAGFPSRAALLDDLNRRSGDLYRIELGPVDSDPRVALRATVPDDAGVAAVANRLARLDARAREGPWTLNVLELLEANPAVRAGDICRLAGMEKATFKLNVRKLKSLGLTESLETGYRLSPRGRAVLDALRRTRRPC